MVHEMNRLALLIAFALLVPSVAEAQSPSLCDTVARIVRSPHAPVEWRSPIQALAGLSESEMNVDMNGSWLLTTDKVLEKLNSDYKAEPDLIEAAGQRASHPLKIFRFGKSGLHFIAAWGGSDSCKSFVFFDATKGAAHLIDGPAVVQGPLPLALCTPQSGHAAEIGGVPAFLVQTVRENSVEFSLTPWREDAWQEACKVVLQFHHSFHVIRRFCRGVNCLDMDFAVQQLVSRLDAKLEEGGRPIGLEDFARASGLDNHLPTFGEALPFDFAEDDIFTPVTINDETYLARVGHAHAGWQSTPDYLFAAYRMTSGKPEPVAGLYIEKRRDRPIDVKAD
jgi:hypothetical protein